ncbi:MAG TPA: hypothetical protein VGN96_09715 [Roseococcus sp.]|jgi:hypothetical protein|nr:hypothetical protein [Roseococcus sp.]
MLHEGRASARFAELVKLHMQGRRFLDREQERRLLEEGVGRYGLTLEEATGVVRAHAEGTEIALEGDLSRSGGQLLRTMADRHGRISREDFGKVASFYRMRAGAGLSQAEAERRVKRLMEEMELQPRRSGRLLRTRRWYRAIEA